MTVDPNQFDYVMYVDASGDDGFQFEKGSTTCFAAAAFLVKREDIDHNLALLRGIKKIVGAKETDEVKYSTVRRHPRAPEALSLLRDLKGKLSCYVVFKKELSPAQIPPKGSKALSVDCHLMSLRSLDAYSFADNDKVLIAIDHMKSTEEIPVNYHMHKGIFSDEKHPDRNFTSETVFCDSKDADFLLIQVADLLAGVLREHFEQYESNPDMLHFHSLCPKCEQIFKMKRRNARAMCKQGKSRTTKLAHSKNLHYIIHLIPCAYTFPMTSYFFMWPVQMMTKHFYLLCARK